MARTKDEQGLSVKRCFYQKWWFWGIVLLFIGVCALNIYLAYISNQEYANLFTAISGWVSGVATAFIGFIAYFQNNRYTLLNLKRDTKQQIYEERKAFVDLYNKNVFPNKLTDLLSVVIYPCQDENQQRTMYDLQLNNLRQDLFSFLQSIQAFNFIPDNLLEIIEEIKKMLDCTYKHYEKIKHSLKNDETVINEIKIIGEESLKWIKKMLQLKQRVFNEYDSLLDKIEDSYRIVAIEAILKQCANETKAARRSITETMKND